MSLFVHARLPQPLKFLFIRDHKPAFQHFSTEQAGCDNLRPDREGPVKGKVSETRIAATYGNLDTNGDSHGDAFCFPLLVQVLHNLVRPLTRHSDHRRRLRTPCVTGKSSLAVVNDAVVGVGCVTVLPDTHHIIPAPVRECFYKVINLCFRQHSGVRFSKMVSCLRPIVTFAVNIQKKPSYFCQLHQSLFCIATRHVVDCKTKSVRAVAKVPGIIIIIIIIALIIAITLALTNTVRARRFR